MSETLYPRHASAPVEALRVSAPPADWSFRVLRWCMWCREMTTHETDAVGTFAGNVTRCARCGRDQR